MEDKKRLVVLTSGGDAPGMNAAIRAVTRKALNMDAEVFAAIDGFKGLSKGEFIQLNYETVGERSLDHPAILNS